MLQLHNCVLAPYLSAFMSFINRKLGSRFRCGCHGLHVDTGNTKPVDKTDLGCSVFVLFVALTQQKISKTLCLTALHLPPLGTDLVPFPGGLALLLSSFFASQDPRLIAMFLHERFAHR